MSGFFGEAAARLAGQAALVIGWPPHLFWDATPAELAAVLTATLPPAAEGVDRNTINAMLERERNG